MRVDQENVGTEGESGCPQESPTLSPEFFPQEIRPHCTQYLGEDKEEFRASGCVLRLQQRQPIAQMIGQRCIIIENGITMPVVEIRRPARIEVPGSQAKAQFSDSKDMEFGIRGTGQARIGQEGP